MAVNAPFYVMNEKDELVPAKFLVGPDPNPFNPGILLEQGYVPQSNINQDRNALNAFLNPNSGSIGRSALIF